MSKGSNRRPENAQAFRDNYDRIFKKKLRCLCCGGEPAGKYLLTDGRVYAACDVCVLSCSYCVRELNGAIQL